MNAEPAQGDLSVKSPAYTWHGSHWADVVSSQSWRHITDPLDREHAEREVRTKAAEQKRTLEALENNGFTRATYSFWRDKKRILAKNGWVRMKNAYAKFERFTNEEAVAELNRIVAAKIGAT